LFFRSNVAAQGRTIARIFHFASPSGPRFHQHEPLELLTVNGLGTMTLVDFAIEQRARLIYASIPEFCSTPLTDIRSSRADVHSTHDYLDTAKRFGEAIIATNIYRYYTILYRDTGAGNSLKLGFTINGVDPVTGCDPRGYSTNVVLQAATSTIVQ
jgi:hypothetical protein